MWPKQWLLLACGGLCHGTLRDPPPPPVPGNWTPTWTPNWNLTESTVIQPSHPAGYLSLNHTFGLVSLDFGTASSIWFAGGANASNATATSVEGCRCRVAAYPPPLYHHCITSI